MQIDHVHFYVEDAQLWRDWFVRHLGFEALSYYRISLASQKSQMWGSHASTEIVKNGSVYFLLSSPLSPTSPVAEFLRQHPPGVADVAFAVEDVEAAIAQALAHKTKVIKPIEQHQYGNTYIKWAKIAAWGSLTHTLVEKRVLEQGSRGTGELGSRGDEESGNSNSPMPPSSFFSGIDHIVLNVAGGELESAVAWYEKVLGFSRQQRFKIKTDRSGLYSQVLVSPNGSIQLPINEPASSNSQIQEFLDVNNGPGIQHIALRTPNLVNAIAQFRQNGLSLLRVPKSYYTDLKKRQRFPLSAQQLQAIAQAEILVDWNEQTADGNMNTPLLLQIFTQPIFGKPTFFFEFIERLSQARGFGEGNFRALFEAIEREQIKRGSLFEGDRSQETGD